MEAPKPGDPAAGKAPARPAALPIRRPSAPRKPRRLAPNTCIPLKGFIGLIARREEPKPNIHRIPSSADALLGAELVWTLSALNLTDSWYAFVPSMLGTSPATDAAARAVNKAHKLCATPGTPTALARCDSSYLTAINALRTSLDLSDSALVAAGLVYLYEGIMKGKPRGLHAEDGKDSALTE
ncbi:hypothetical protein LTR53_003612 [Teratosphaeriaceae sp. CCFEE 6253]|nr:hypothetical protein LTR53_003612 [Teratosphaeriaceae sp. CCFEE 6253]